MKWRIALIGLIALALVPLARSGHELPVYPSYYPHEIEIRTVAPDAAGALLRDGKLHAYVGAGPDVAGAVPDALRAVESLGSFVVLRLNARTDRALSTACEVRERIVRDIATSPGALIVHPYPVTPLHGDYLHHVDLAEVAKARMLAAKANPPTAGDAPPKIKPVGSLPESLVPAERRAQDTWDAELVEVRASDLIETEARALNGWQGPEWLKAGWFHAALLLGTPSDTAEARQHIDRNLDRLRARAYADAAERINLERDLVRELSADCRRSVVGYSVKREYHNAEFSAGIENIAFDALTGLNSPMFLRTVKLKDFPWNGWLQLGIGAQPAAAWNPIAGFNDGFGRLMWSAVGDPAALPSPYDSAWVLNRISDVQSVPQR